MNNKINSEYSKLFRANVKKTGNIIKAFDNEIDITGKCQNCVEALLQDNGYISEEDLREFSDNIRQKITKKIEKKNKFMK